MKKIIAAALSVLVGAFGYTIVDSAIEDRVSNLESEVVELREIISDYHNNITETILTTISDTTTRPTTTAPTTTNTTPAMTPLQKWLSENYIPGYIYEPASDFFYTDDKECWQKNAGYNEFYDNYAPAVAMYIDQLRVRFEYEGKDWMIQLWKGQYGWLFVGAETGVYTAPAGTYKGGAGDPNHYSCADKEDWLDIQLDCYWSRNNTGYYEKAFTRPYDKHWWTNGYVWGRLTKYTKPRTELKAKNRITFKSEEMANLFVQGLREAGFIGTSSSDNLVDDSYFQNGKDVWLLWSSINHDAFVGYTDATIKITDSTSTTNFTIPDIVVTLPEGTTTPPTTNTNPA